MDELISVIVPVFNTAPYLKRCVDSILRQSYQDFELLLIDDGSKDGSGEMCDDFAQQNHRVKVFHQDNSGVCAARNMGLENMRGTYFMFLDSDDTLDTNALKLCHERIVRDNSDVVVFGWQQIKNDQIIETGVYGDEKINDSIRVVREILADRHIYGGGYPNKMWRTKAFIESGQEVPRFNPKLFYVEDMEWVIRMMLVVKNISLLNEIFYNYHLRDDSASRSNEAHERRLVGYHDTMKEIVNDLSRVSDVQDWFCGVYYSELINSTLDAVIKRQNDVVQRLIERLNCEKKAIMCHSGVSQKCKVRCVVLLIAHALKRI